MVAVIGIANSVVKISVMVSTGAVYGLVTYSLYSDAMVAVIVLAKY